MVGGFCSEYFNIHDFSVESREIIEKVKFDLKKNSQIKVSYVRITTKWLGNSDQNMATFIGTSVQDKMSNNFAFGRSMEGPPY